MPSQLLLVRTPKEASVLSVEDTTHKVTEQSSSGEPVSQVVWARDGTIAAVITESSLRVVAGDSLQPIGDVTAPHANAAAFSDSSELLLTHQRAFKQDGNPGKNLILWRWRTGERLLQLTHRAFVREDWPCLQLTPNAAEAFHATTNTATCYRVGAGPLRRLQLKGLGGFAVAPAGEPRLAAYVAEAKGSPGFVGVWNHAALPAGGDPPAPLARRSFFRANQVKLMWASTGKALLALTSSDSDPTNRSYYGDAKLHFLSADGNNDALLQLKDGPVHDARWAPDGSAFAVVAGFMPSRTQVFDAACRQIADLGCGSHNLLRWSPHAHFLAVAGFGNLPGDIAFYEKAGPKEFQQLGSARAENGVVAEWAPSGRVLLVATTAPRLRVDNGFALYSYAGSLLGKHAYEVLLEATWRPVAPGTFPDRPSSPGRRPAASSAASSSSHSAPQNGAAPQASQGYVPPHLRDQPGSGPAPISLGHDPPKAAFRSARLPPGAEPAESKAPGASKSARKRSNKAKSKAAAAAEGVSGAGEGEEELDQHGQGSGVQQGDTVHPGVSGAQPEHTPTLSSQQEGDAGKRIRALQKKLRQVQQLREKAEQGATLESGQQQKLAGEGAIIAELQSLGISA